MPLIETVTGPDLRTPDEVAEAILLVGRVCRSTGHVRVGMGASRQDVNVSVRGGRRVEIKGVPQAGWAPRLVHGEAVRQVNLLKLRDELVRRGFSAPGSIAVEQRRRHLAVRLVRGGVPDGRRLGEVRSRARSGVRASSWANGPFTVRAIRFTGLAGTLSWPTQPDCIFAHELAGRIRVIAGLDQQPILLHSEKWPDYHGSLQELRKVRAHLGATPRTASSSSGVPDEDTITAVNEIRLRYVDAIDGIPNETRQPFADGSTDFERILPGPDRMYPDTDSPPSRVTRERVERLHAALSPRPWEREARYRAAGVPTPAIHYLIRRGGARLVDKVVDACQAPVKQAGLLFGERVKALRRDGVAVDAIPDARWCELFTVAAERPVLWQAWAAVVRAMAASPSQPVLDIVESLQLGVAPAAWSQRAEAAVAGARPRLFGAAGDNRLFRFSMGLAMRELRGRVPALEVADAVRTAIGAAAEARTEPRSPAEARAQTTERRPGGGIR